MNRPFRKRVSLTDKERAEFQELVERLRPVPSSTSSDRRLGLVFRVRGVFWRHHRLATLLLPLGLAVMLVAVLTWWPLGLLGAPLVVGGLVALGEVATVGLRRRRLLARERKP